MHYRRACYDLKRKKGATKPQVTTLTTSSEHNSNKNMEEKLFLSAYVCVCAFYFAAAAAAGGIEDTVPRRTYICAKPKTSSTHSMQLAALFFPSFYCKTSRSRKKKKSFLLFFMLCLARPYLSGSLFSVVSSCTGGAVTKRIWEDEPCCTKRKKVTFQSLPIFAVLLFFVFFSGSYYHEL